MGLEILDRIDLFSSLTTDELERLAITLKPRQCPAQTILVREGQSDESFYILAEGQVEIMKALGTDEERCMGIQTPGAILGEMGFFSADGAHTASVRAITPLRLLEMSRSDFEALLLRNPQMAYDLIGLITQRLEESENLIITDLKKKNRQLSIAYQELKAAQAQIIAKEKLERELEIAREIQFSILPAHLPFHLQFDFGALMSPARAIGGDFFDFISMNDEQLGIVVGDVTDKGIPAALFMGLTYSLIRAEADPDLSPQQTLRNVNHLLLQMDAAGMFVTMIYGILNLKSGVFHYARAGHTLPIVIDGDGRSVPVPVGPGQPLGLYEGISIDEQRITIPAGGLVLLSSDGLSEAMNMQGKLIDPATIQHILVVHQREKAAKICEGLWNAVLSFGGKAGQYDDFTAVVIKRNAS